MDNSPTNRNELPEILFVANSYDTVRDTQKLCGNWNLTSVIGYESALIDMQRVLIHRRDYKMVLILIESPSDVDINFAFGPHMIGRRPGYITLDQLQCDHKKSHLAATLECWLRY